jgi:hypothetical protein
VTSHIASQRAKERPNLEQTFFGRDPPQFVFTASIKTDRVQYLEKRSKGIHFPIMRFSEKAHAPLIEAPHKLHIIRN